MRPLPMIMATAALAASLTACGDDEPGPRQAASPLPSVATSAPAGTTAPAPTVTATRPAFPPAVTEPVQGAGYFAVYLALVKGDASDQPAEEAKRQAAAVGYEATTGDIDCDQGARAALGLDPEADYRGTSVLFATAALARLFVDAYEPGVIGTAQVRAFCLD